ncbi:MAG TPA: enoyl-CoA hydratase-related protein [Candidatus Thermoplasmatota archaeon]|nr:enoyl-CoA hydratase-related protein [Candidatus Thermoplasmatota archaeon]
MDGEPRPVGDTRAWGVALFTEAIWPPWHVVALSPMADFQFLKTKVEGTTAVLTLNAPPVNALSPKILLELESALDGFAANEELRAIVLTAAGTNAFSAGADLNELAKLDPKSAQEVVLLGHRVFNKIEAHRLPVIAAINNLTLGGGLELTLACDLRISSDRARFGAPEVQLGLIPAWGGTQRLTRIVGVGKAKELILTGQWINAQEALRIGLLNKVVPDGDEVRAAMDIAKLIGVKCAPLAVSAAKEAITKGQDLPLEEGLGLELASVGAVAGSEDLKEGITAMLEKRAPQYKGK